MRTASKTSLQRDASVPKERFIETNNETAFNSDEAQPPEVQSKDGIAAGITLHARAAPRPHLPIGIQEFVSQNYQKQAILGRLRGKIR